MSDHAPNYCLHLAVNPDLPSFTHLYLGGDQPIDICHPCWEIAGGGCRDINNILRGVIL